MIPSDQTVKQKMKFENAGPQGSCLVGVSWAAAQKLDILCRMVGSSLTRIGLLLARFSSVGVRRGTRDSGLGTPEIFIPFSLISYGSFFTRHGRWEYHFFPQQRKSTNSFFLVAATVNNTRIIMLAFIQHKIHKLRRY